MELTNLSKEILLQAQMLRMEGKMEKLCAEHIFYGLLLAACYKEEPLNGSEYRKEAETLRTYLERNVRSIASARYQVKEDAVKNNGLFQDGSNIILKASEAAGSKPIDALTLAKAVIEDPTPAVMLLMNFKHTQHTAEDAKYEPAQPVRPVVNNNAGSNKQNDEPEKGTSTIKAMLALALLAAALDNQKSTLQQNSVHVNHQNQHVKRRTKMGPFTYRGGTVAAAIQYFLFGLLVPAAILFGLEKWVGFVTAPSTPFLQFLLYAFVILWAFYLARGVTLLLGLASNAFGLFLNLATDFALVGALGKAVQLVWYPDGFPTWLKIVMCVVCLLVLVIGTALYDLLKSEGDKLKTKIMLGTQEGTPVKIFFKSLTKALLWPFLYFAIVWIFHPAIPVWGIRCAEILGFLWVWSQFQTLYTCVLLHRQKSLFKSGKGAKFLIGMHLFQFPVEMVLFLHWIFAWFPMKTWVIVVLAVFGFIGLINSILYANADSTNT